MVDRENLAYRTNKYTYSFKNFPTINTFGGDIYNGAIILKEVNKDQSDSLGEILIFRERIKPKKP